jgi:hypothetical protein
MSNELTKPAGPTAALKQAKDAASRLKGELMKDALGRILDEDGEKQPVPGKPRVILALANHAHTAGWDRAKVLQRAMFKAAADSGLEMKFAFYGPDNAAGVRRCRITTRWIIDPDDMAGVIDRAECSCGCYYSGFRSYGSIVFKKDDDYREAVIKRLREGPFGSERKSWIDEWEVDSTELDVIDLLLRKEPVDRRHYRGKSAPRIDAIPSTTRYLPHASKRPFGRRCWREPAMSRNQGPAICQQRFVCGVKCVTRSAVNSLSVRHRHEIDSIVLVA